MSKTLRYHVRANITPDEDFKKDRKLEQVSLTETNRTTPARNSNANEDKKDNELAELLKAKIREVDILLEQMSSQTANKKTESYPVVLSDLLDIREEWKKTTVHR